MKDQKETSTITFKQFFYIKWLWLASIIELVNLPLTNIQVDKFYSKKEKLKVDQGHI
jgi:hypothetical protein